MLDEATSNLDVESEALVLEALKDVCKNKTTIAVAHRIKTVEEADQIIVLDKGNVVGIGTHQELMKSSSLYKKIVECEFIEGGEGDEEN